MTKTFKQFIQDYDIDLSKCEICSSERQLYEESDVPITWINLHKPIDGQDYIVLSKKLATEFLTNCDVKILRNADAKLDPEHGWGLICHQPVKTYNVNLADIFADSSKSDNHTTLIEKSKGQDGINLNKLKKALYTLKKRIDENEGYVPQSYKYSYVIIDTEKYIADIDYIDEDEYGEHGTSHLSGKRFNTTILDNIDSFAEKYETIMMYRERAESLYMQISSYAEKAIKRYYKPDIIVDFSANIITIDENYDTDIEESLYRIDSNGYGDFSCLEDEDGGLSYYEEVDYKRIRKKSWEIIEDHYDVDLFDVEE